MAEDLKVTQAGSPAFLLHIFWLWIQYIMISFLLLGHMIDVVVTLLSFSVDMVELIVKGSLSTLV